MKRFIKAALVVGLIATLFIVLTSGGSAAPPGQPFIGAWWSVDSGDGSKQTLWIRRGKGGYYVDYYDDATLEDTCPGGYPLIGMGTGKPSGNDFEADLEWWCLPDPPGDPAFPRFSTTWSYTYNSMDGTLTDEFGDVWERIPPAL